MTSSKPPAVVLIAASAGGVQALSTILHGLPKSFSAPIVIALHRPPGYESLLPSILKRQTALPVVEANAGEALKPGTVYIAKADQHLTVDHAGRFAYMNGHRIRHVLSSANPLFISAADVFGGGAIGVVLTGTDSDGTDGVQAISGEGGVVIAQNRATSEFFDMPRSAIHTGVVDYVLPLDEIAPALVRVVDERSHLTADPAPA
jgi:two-component system, chemotaxis family, protein-glutamate methylesterase/glutaminase